jgi:hypothetical protein
MLSALGTQIQSNLKDGMHSRGRPPLYGAYEVESFAGRGRPSPGGPPEGSSWQAVMIDPKPSFNRMPGNAVGRIRTASGPLLFAVDADTIAKTLRFQPLGGPAKGTEWAYSTLDSSRLLLTGIGAERSDSLLITLRRRGSDAFPLLAREPWRPDFWFKER